MTEKFALCERGNLTRDEVDEKMSTGFYVMEAKLDGVRVMACRDGNSVTLTTRGGMDITAKFPYLQEAVRKLPVPMSKYTLVLDGEILAPDRKFATVQRSIASKFLSTTTFEYHIFDILRHGTREDIQNDNYLLRKSVLLEMFSVPTSLRYVPYTSDAHEYMLDYEQFQHDGGEGVVLKHKKKPYITGRGSGWLRSKFCDTISVMPLYVYDDKTVEMGLLTHDDGMIMVGTVQVPDDDLFLMLQKDLMVVLEVTAYGVDKQTLKMRHCTYHGMRFDVDQTACTIDQLEKLREF